VILESREVVVRYRGAGRAALDRATCGVAAAELVAVVGPNGSGKTTLVRALTGLVPISGGAVLVDQRPVAGWDRPAFARVVGVVPQREELVFPLTVAETVLLGRYARMGPFAAPGAADAAAVDAALRRCDVEALRERSVDSLSGGEWQRVRIARALAQEPRALILDEPTASLDVRHEMELFELIRQLVADGLAGLVITHHLNLAARFADRIVLLSDGQVVATGRPATVLTKERLTTVFGWPVAVTTWCDGSPQVVPLRPGEAAP
jgi:ABC-type cobalamin/Fe3+-siderophores transport system ATPase subunit